MNGQAAIVSRLVHECHDQEELQSGDARAHSTDVWLVVHIMNDEVGKIGPEIPRGDVGDWLETALAGAFMEEEADIEKGNGHDLVTRQKQAGENSHSR